MLQLLKKLYPKSKLAVVAPESSAWILKQAEDSGATTGRDR